MKKESISLLLGLAALLSLALTVYLWLAVNHSNANYTEVQARVLSSEQKVKKVKHTRITTYDVKLIYEGKTYDLINAHSTVPYQPLQNATVYFSDGNLYARHRRD